MIPRYSEQSLPVEVHSEPHEPGTECQCWAVFRITARYAWDADDDHKVHVQVNPDEFPRAQTLTLRPDVVRALASALSFAAIDAETLNRDFPAGDAAEREIDGVTTFPVGGESGGEEA